jgi:hypothetical protein
MRLYTVNILSNRTNGCQLHSYLIRFTHISSALQYFPFLLRLFFMELTVSNEPGMYTPGTNFPYN